MRAGRVERQARIEERVSLDHLAAQMNALAGAGKLGDLEDYLKRVRPRRRRSPLEMLQTLKDAAARGAPIAISPSS